MRRFVTCVAVVILGLAVAGSARAGGMKGPSGPGKMGPFGPSKMSPFAPSFKISTGAKHFPFNYGPGALHYSHRWWSHQYNAYLFFDPITCWWFYVTADGSYLPVAPDTVLPAYPGQ